MSLQQSMDHVSRLHRLSTWKFIPEGDEALSVLIHLLSWVLHRQGSWLCTGSMTIVVIPACECKSPLKWAAMGETSVFLCRISERWLFILQWRGHPISPTYCWPHLLHVIRHIALEDLQEVLIITLAVMYHPHLPSFCLTIKQHLSILHVSERLQRAFLKPPLIAFCRLKNLKDLLVQASLTSMSQLEPGNLSCGAARCKACPMLLGMDAFSSHTTGERFKVVVRPSCKFSSVIYLITCRRCGQQYLGEMGWPLHYRMNGHGSDIMHRRTKVSPVAAHFSNDSHSQADMTVIVIDQMYNHDPFLHMTWESRWIRTLRTLSPLEGMNLWVDSL